MRGLSRRRVTRMLFGSLAAYVLVCGAFYWLQDRLLFSAAGQRRGQPLPQVRGVAVERLARADGAAFRVAVASHPEAKAWLLFFCGNGEDLHSGVYWAKAWCDYGLSVAVVEYPGYGDSDGAPSEASLGEAAEVAGAAFSARAQAQGLPLLTGGASLGSHAAVRACAAGFGSRLLLLAPFTSVRDVAASRYWFLPVGLVLRHPMDSVALAPRVKVPALVLHGDLDTVVPTRYGRALADALGARFELAPGCGHNDLPVERVGPFGRLLAEFLLGN